jgi:hypothetical protein
MLFHATQTSAPITAQRDSNSKVPLGQSICGKCEWKQKRISMSNSDQIISCNYAYESHLIETQLGIRILPTSDSRLSMIGVMVPQ